FAADGKPLGRRIAVSVDRVSSPERPDVAVHSKGDFVVVWTDGDVHGQRVDSAGNLVGDQFVVNRRPRRIQRVAKVAALGNGEFVVVWDEYGKTGIAEVVARRYIDPRAVPSCDPGTVTIDGTEGDDVLIGTAGADVILGRGGDDSIYGNGGADTICGGDGDDRISAGGAGDVIHGGRGADQIAGNSGDDILLGDVGDDVIHGGSGDDILIGQGGTDALIGGAGADICDGRICD
ncbi:MAG: serralysin, partial [Candidatus Binatota bacterium]|nr:serralysin [Candidatus Binatota bacterium]